MFKIRAKQFDRHRIFVKNGIVKFAIGHLFRVDEFVMQSTKLQGAQQVCALIKRPDRAVERAAHLGHGIVAFKSDIVDERLHALLRSSSARGENS